MKKDDAKLACWSTADALLTLWSPSYLPLMTRRNVKFKVQRLYERFREVRDSKKSAKTYAEKKMKFLEELKIHFDISAEGALDIIAADKTLSLEDREEDRNFLLAIRDDRPHTLGVLDVKRLKRFERAAAKRKLESDRAEKEQRRQEVKKIDF